MALRYPDLSTLNEAKVQEVLDFLSQRLGEYAPDLERKRGVLRDIVLHLEGVFAAAQASIIESWDRSASLLAIEQDAPGADSDIVDRVLSNFRLVRNLGAKATGTVTIVLDSLTPVTIPSSMSFVSGSVSFMVNSSYAARTSTASVSSSTDRLIVDSGGGEYSFSIDVTAAAVGADGLARRSATMTPQISIPHLVRAYASSDFTGGVDAQTNQDLLEALAAGLAQSSPSNRSTIASLVIDSVPACLAVSVVGYGDTEQRRYHSVLPVAFGGRVDVYTRTSALPESVPLTLTATLLEKLSGGSVWQVTLTRGLAPGFYEVDRIVVEGDDGDSYVIQEMTRGLDLTDDGSFIPDLASAEEAAFSRFQTAVIKFLDTDTDVSAMTEEVSTKSYDVYPRALPSISTLQDDLTHLGVRPAAADILVRAPVPCFVAVYFEIRKKSTEDDPDLEAIQTTVAAYVNDLGFETPLSASGLSYAVHGHLVGTQTTGPMDMHGRVLRPDGVVRYLHSSDSLSFPDEPEAMVSGKTGAFFLNREDIYITVVTA